MNIALWTLGPQLLFRSVYSKQIDERVNNLWRVHKNRVDQGLGGTYTSSNLYNDKHKEEANVTKMGLNFSLDSYIKGYKEEIYMGNPFSRFHESVAKNGTIHETVGDIELEQTDNFERAKYFNLSEKDSYGEVSVIPL